MNLFDRICAILAFPLGIVFLVLGVLGLFVGSRAQFTLPPILGGVPALVGWGIVRSIAIAWHVRREVPPTQMPRGLAE